MLHLAWQILQVPLAIATIGLAALIFVGELYLGFVIFYATRNSYRKYKGTLKQEAPDGEV